MATLLCNTRDTNRDGGRGEHVVAATRTNCKPQKQKPVRLKSRQSLVHAQRRAFLHIPSSNQTHRRHFQSGISWFERQPRRGRTHRQRSEAVHFKYGWPFRPAACPGCGVAVVAPRGGCASSTSFTSLWLLSGTGGRASADEKSAGGARGCQCRARVAPTGRLRQREAGVQAVPAASCVVSPVASAFAVSGAPAGAA